MFQNSTLTPTLSRPTGRGGKSKTRAHANTCGNGLLPTYYIATVTVFTSV